MQKQEKEESIAIGESLVLCAAKSSRRLLLHDENAEWTLCSNCTLPS